MKDFFETITENISPSAIYGDMKGAPRMFYLFTLLVMLGSIIGAFINTLTNKPVTAALHVLSLVPALFSIFLVQRRKFEGAATLLAVALILINTLIATEGMGIHSVSNIIFPVILIIASLVTSRRTLYLLTSLIVVCIGWLAFGEANGWYALGEHTGNAASDFWSLTILIIITALIVYILTFSLHQGFSRLRSEIEERKKLEESLRQREAILEAVTFTAEQFLKTPGWRKNIDMALERLGRTINATHAYLFEDHLNAQGEPVTSMRYEWTAPGFKSDLNLPLYQNSLIHQPGFEEAVEKLSRGEVRAGNTATFNDAEKTAMQEIGIRSILEVPVFVDGKEWGAIGFDDMENERPWANAEVDALKIAAQILSAAISREKADTALQESERLYRQAIEAAGAVPYLHDHINNCYIFMGAGIEKIVGYKPEELTPSLWRQIVKKVTLRGEAEGLGMEEAIQLARTGQIREWRSDVWMLARNGEERWLADSAIELFDDSDTSYASIGILQDITERKLTEVNLIKHESLLQAVTFAAEQFLRATDWRETIDSVLERLGREFDVSHAYLFEKHIGTNGESMFSMTHEWTAANAQTDLGDMEFQNVPLHSMGFERMYNLLDSGQPLVGSASWLNPFEKDYLNSINLKALLEIRVSVNGEQWGTFGVDDVYKEREWNPIEVDVLRVAAGMLGSAIERHLNNDALENDLTERKQLIGELERRNAEAETLRETTAIITSTLDTEEAVRQILVQLKRVVQYDSASVWLYEGDNARVVGSNGLPSGALEPGIFRIQDSEPDTALWKEQLPYVLFEDIQINHSQFREPPINYIHGWLAVPLKARGRLMGFISLDGKRIGHFNDHDAELAANYANQVSIALENARLFSDLQTELGERTKLIDELEGKNSELERFTYTVSHDLKSPLVTIAGFLRYLEQDVASKDMERFQNDMGRIQGAVSKMQQLLMELLELSRIGRMVNAPVKIPFEDLVREALEAVHGRLEERKVKVIIQQNLPPVYGDLPRLSEVLQNLLENASKYMGSQPNPLIEIGSQGMEADKPIFFVKDNGIGIAPEHHERIFELFTKLDSNTDGTGVGLALVKRIIEVHGGRIWVESKAGQGATFYFTLPTETAEV